MLIDDVTIKVTAGKGGSGAIAFDKTKMGQGPTGGNGGNGGNIYLKGVANLSALKQFRYQKEIKAGNGKNGMGKLKDGATGKNIILKIPIGTLILLLNAPLFLIAFFRVGKEFFIKAITGTVLLSIFLNAFEHMKPATTDRFLAFITT